MKKTRAFDQLLVPGLQTVNLAYDVEKALVADEALPDWFASTKVP